MEKHRCRARWIVVVFAFVVGVVAAPAFAQDASIVGTTTFRVSVSESIMREAHGVGEPAAGERAFSRAH